MEFIRGEHPSTTRCAVNRGRVGKPQHLLRKRPFPQMSTLVTLLLGRERLRAKKRVHTSTYEFPSFARIPGSRCTSCSWFSRCSNHNVRKRKRRHLRTDASAGARGEPARAPSEGAHQPRS